MSIDRHLSSDSLHWQQMWDASVWSESECYWLFMIKTTKLSDVPQRDIWHQLRHAVSSWLLEVLQRVVNINECMEEQYNGDQWNTSNTFVLMLFLCIVNCSSCILSFLTVYIHSCIYIQLCMYTQHLKIHFLRNLRKVIPPLVHTSPCSLYNNLSVLWSCLCAYWSPSTSCRTLTLSSFASYLLIYVWLHSGTHEAQYWGKCWLILFISTCANLIWMQGLRRN